MTDLEEYPDRAVEACREAEARLASTIAGLDDDAVRAPSLLEGWSVGHVLTHLARNADGHRRRVAGSLAGVGLAKYERGAAQRAEEIEAGAGRPAAEILEDVRASAAALLDVFDTAVEAGWPQGYLTGGERYPVKACPAHRLREIEMHHADLGMRYTDADWPEEYVAWDLDVVLASLHDRLELTDRRSLLAWAAGRGPVDAAWSPRAWG